MFLTEQTKREKLDATTKPLTNWKTEFLGAHTALEREQHAFGKHGDNFGRADSSITIPNAHATQSKIIEHLDGHLDAMIAEVTNEKVMLEQIVKNNSVLTATITNQNNNIKKILGEVKSLRKTSSNSVSTTAPTTQLLSSDIRFK